MAINQVWEKVGHSLGLSFTPGRGRVSPVLSGELKGNEVSVVRLPDRGGSKKATTTQFKLTYPEPLGLGLRLTRENLIASMTRTRRDIQVGDADFDDEVVVQGRDPKKIRAFLTPARRMRIQRLLSACEGCTIGDAYIIVRRAGAIDDASRMISVLRRMAHLAWFLAGDRAEQDRPLDRAIQARREGRLEDAIPVLQAAEPAEVPTLQPLEEMVFEGEVLLLTGEREKAAELLEKARVEAPEDPEIRDWSRIATDRVPAPAPPAEEEGIPIDMASVCAALFQSDLSSSEVIKRFEKRYLGQSVFWKGVLLRANRFSYDVLFGQEPGTKAVFEIHEIPAGLYGNRKVQVVLQLSLADGDLLGPPNGQTISFEGKLVRCDPFMRNLYLADGILLD